MKRTFERVTTRRRFAQGLVAGGVLAGAGAWLPRRAVQAASVTDVSTLRGPMIDLTVAAHEVNFTGVTRTATLANGTLPGPILRWREGDDITLRVRNALRVDTAIHWHGVLTPANRDGVPGLSFHGIAPGESYDYRFLARQSGTYWYHAHADFQEQTGAYGAIVIEPREPEPFEYDREHVVLLSDWTDRDPLDLYLLLKRHSDYFNHNRRTLGDFVRDSRSEGFGDALHDRFAWARMRMSPTDLADVGGHAYTYLVNGNTPARNWTALFAPGERVRLRIINGSSMTTFDVRIPGLAMTVVAADGQHVRPVEVDEFRIAAAEVLDVLVEPRGADAFTLFAQSLDRSGYARATLAVRDGLEAAVPALDPPILLSMADMGHAGHGMPAAEPSSDEHAERGDSAAPAAEHAGHGDVSAPAPAHADHESHAATDHSVHAMEPQAHPPTETHNPAVDMQSATPMPRLADPGVGLRENGRRVLAYADLHSTFADPDGRAPGRTIELHLTGHMDRFLWSFDGVPFSSAEPLVLEYGERVRFVLVNDTMMEHPIHLHGMWSDLEDEHGEFLVRKHTISIPPGTKRSFRVTADALGRWAFHCHLLYHMTAGMFREVRVEEGATPPSAEHEHQHVHAPEPESAEPVHAHSQHAHD
ncbi:MAG TPA: copper resistance system multicopper oxidase [Gammaproteobacteria bacterium]|nr:copper resistance system multicopper oxidase [Gammaproteobacteria bacterium]